MAGFDRYAVSAACQHPTLAPYRGSNPGLVSVIATNAGERMGDATAPRRAVSTGSGVIVTRECRSISAAEFSRRANERLKAKPKG
jgi:hypothetical protein